VTGATTEAGSLCGLFDVAGITVLFNVKRAGPKALVAAGTLLVQGIGSFRDFLIAFVQLVTFAARSGFFVFIFRKGVMTVTARQSIPIDIEVFFMLENNISRSDFKLQPDGFPGRFGRECGVAQNPHKQEIND
jgi:hypothetical protein